MKFKLSMQIEFDDGIISEKELRLLTLIAELGSLKAAAAHEEISYKNAWDKLRIASQIAKEPLLDSSSKKTGAKLTDFAKTILNKYEQFNDFATSLDQDFSPRLSAQNKLSSSICALEYCLGGALISIAIDKFIFKAIISITSLNELNLKLNKKINFIFKVYCLKLFDKATDDAAKTNVFSAVVTKCTNTSSNYICELDFCGHKLTGLSPKELSLNELYEFKIDPSSIIVML